MTHTSRVKRWEGFKKTNNKTHNVLTHKSTHSLQAAEQTAPLPEIKYFYLAHLSPWSYPPMVLPPVCDLSEPTRNTRDGDGKNVDTMLSGGAPDPVWHRVSLCLFVCLSLTLSLSACLSVSLPPPPPPPPSLSLSLSIPLSARGGERGGLGGDNRQKEDVTTTTCHQLTCVDIMLSGGHRCSWSCPQHSYHQTERSSPLFLSTLYGELHYHLQFCSHATVWAYSSNSDGLICQHVGMLSNSLHYHGLVKMVSAHWPARILNSFVQVAFFFFFETQTGFCGRGFRKHLHTAYTSISCTLYCFTVVLSCKRHDRWTHTEHHWKVDEAICHLTFHKHYSLSLFPANPLPPPPPFLFNWVLAEGKEEVQLFFFFSIRNIKI